MTAPLPLSQLDSGIEVKVLAFSPDNPHARRLLDLGLRPGARVQVLRRTGTHEPVVVMRGPIRIMLDAAVKHEVLVSGPAGQS